MGRTLRTRRRPLQRSPGPRSRDRAGRRRARTRRADFHGDIAESLSQEREDDRGEQDAHGVDPSDVRFDVAITLPASELVDRHDRIPGFAKNTAIPASTVDASAKQSVSPLDYVCRFVEHE